MTEFPAAEQVLVDSLTALDARLVEVCDAEERRAALLAGDRSAGWDAVRNLAQPPAAGLLGDPLPGPLLVPGHPVLDRVGRAAGLDPIATDVLLLLLAPHIEPRYSTLYGVLQDDVGEHRATERLVHAVLGDASLARPQVRAALSTGGPLMRSGLVRRVPGPYPPLSRPLELAEEFIEIAFGVGNPGIQGAVDTHWTTGTAISGSRDHIRLLVVHGVGDTTTLARSLLPGDRQLLITETPPGPDAMSVCRRAWRTALCTGAALLLDLRSWPEQDVGPAVGELSPLVRSVGGRAWFATRQPVAAALPHHEAGPAGWAERRAAWINRLATPGVVLPAGAADRLASRHRLDPPAIAALLDGLPSPTLAAIDAEAAAAAAVNVPASRRSSTNRSLDDLVLAPGTRAALDRLVHYVARRDTLDSEQGLSDRHAVQRGPLVLFSGRPGTGKTAAAGGVARELGRPLFTLDLSQLLSKYIGETEKQVDEVLRAAQLSGGVLFCDEADALFSSRMEKAGNAGEHFANVLVGYLLQRIEVHEGPVILATNLRHAMDEAFLRRFQFRVEFPLPSAAERSRIWDLLLPPGVPRSAQLDFAAVGARSTLTGGDIANAALRAIFLADREAGRVNQDRLERAVALELMEQGRLSQPAPTDGAENRSPTPNGSPTGPADRGLLLRAFVDTVEECLRTTLRRRFLKEIHVVHGTPSDDRLAGRRPAVSLSLLRLGARRGNHGLRAGFVASAWSHYPEEEYDLIGVAHEALLSMGDPKVADRPAKVHLQESSDFELLHKFWSSHDRPVRASIVLDVEIE